MFMRLWLLEIQIVDSSSSRRMSCEESKDRIICAIYTEVVQEFWQDCVQTHSRTQNELADALATIALMIKHSDTNHIDSLHIECKEHPVHFSDVEEETEGLPWYFDIKKYLETESYLEDSTSNHKKSIRRLALNFFLSEKILYK